MEESYILGLSAKSFLAARAFCLGTSSKWVRIDENVPPDIPVPRSFHADVDISTVVESPANALSVLLPKYARMSEGTESSPAQGTITEPERLAT